MERFASLFYVFVVIALVGPSKGDTAATECTLEVEEGMSINDTMYEKVSWCMSSISFTHMGRNPSTELIRETLTAYCTQGPKLHQCLEGLDEDARHCLDDTEQIRHRLYRQHLQADFDLFCEREGEELVEAFRKQEEKGDNAIVRECLENAKTQVGPTDTANPNGFMLLVYTVLHKGNVCLESHKGQGHDVLFDWVIARTTKAMNRMKCIKDGTDVLCSTIFNSL